MRVEPSRTLRWLLVAVAATVWSLNLYRLVGDREGSGKLPVQRPDPSQALPTGPGRETAPLTAMTWDPFFGRSPRKPPEPDRPTKTEERLPPPPPPPPFRMGYIGHLRGTHGQVLILSGADGLHYLAPAEWIGPWQLLAVTEEALVFRDRDEHRIELQR